MINGFINLYKPENLSSNKALVIVKAILRKQGFTDKIGHFGTLDPSASGVLPIALGRATRLFDYSLDKIKVYDATFRFGAFSASLDRDTEIIYDDSVDIGYEALNAVLGNQIGEIDQIPPIFSAKSVDGVRAYKIARQGGTLNLAPKKIKIYDLQIVEKCEKNVFRIKITCGGGTYVRAIGRDLAADLNTTAVMTSLTREKSGIFDLENSITLAILEENKEKVFDYVIPCEKMLENFTKLTIDKHNTKLLLNGVNISFDGEKFGYYSVYDYTDRLLGVGAVNDENKLYLKTWLL